LEETCKLALTVMRDAIEEKITKDLVQLMVIPTATKQWELRTPEYVEGLLGDLKDLE
jgi:hypothetical protein